MKKRMNILISLIAIVLLMLSGCMAGVTKEQRLEEFKTDALAGRDLSAHFYGSHTSEIDENTFVDIFDFDHGLLFYSGNNIVGSTFDFDWHTDLQGDETASGTFTVVTDGVSETWYISQIDCYDDGTDIPSAP
jgi:hypothetical protein